MNDEQNLAPEASDEDVVKQVSTEEKPEETETPEAAENTTGQEENQPAEGEKPEEEALSRNQRRKAKRQAVIEQFKADAEKTQAQLDAANEKLARYESVAQQTQPPKEADFADYQEYQAAFNAYHSLKAFDEREKTLTQSEAEARQKQLETLNQQTQTEAMGMFEEACTEARERYADFDQVARDASVPVSPTMAEVIVGLDAGPDVLYHLGKHRDQAARIAQLPPVQAAVEIGRIEAVLARPKPIIQTKAPEPIKPVRGGGTPQKDPAKMSNAEYRKARAAGKI